MASNYELFIGSVTAPTYHFDGETIMDLNGEMAVNMIAEELSTDILTATVRYEYVEPLLFVPSDADSFISSDGETLYSYGNENIAAITWSTPIWLYNNLLHVSKFYIDSIERVGRYEYTLNCVSFMGLLDRKTFYGGMYSNAYFEDIAREIMFTDGVSSYVGSEYVYIHEGASSFLVTDDSIESADTFTISFHFDHIGQRFIDNTPTSADPPLNYLIGGYYATSDSSPIYNQLYIGLIPTWDSTANEWVNPEVKILVNSSTTYMFTWQSTGLYITDDTDYTLSIDLGNGTITLNSQTASFTPPASTFDNPLWAIHGGGYNSSTYGNVAECGEILDGYITSVKHYRNNALVGDYIPALNLTKNRPCFFNLVNDECCDETLVSATGYTYQHATIGDEVTVNNPLFVRPGTWRENTFGGVEFDEDIAELAVNGWIPICTCREALQQLMFAYAVNLIKNENDNLIFTWIYDTDPISIADSIIFDEGSVEYTELATKAEITEHSFYYDSSVDSEIVFDNTGGTSANKLFVAFQNAPMYPSFTTTGSISISKQTVNGIVVSGLGTVSAKPYQHNTNIITRQSTTETSGTTVSVTDATLVTLTNSESLADRVFNYYATRQIVKNAIVLGNQNCGRKYTFHNRFMETVSAYLHKMTINATSFLKADCEYVFNYVPTGMGGSYTHGILLTGNGTWTVPSEVFEKPTPRIRVVLIGGGNGGDSGYAGEDGSVSPTYEASYIAPSEGGNYGQPGSGGKIIEVTIDGTDLASSFVYSCGEGGSGGAQCSSHATNNAGSSGGNTTFGSFTSADGVTSETGVTNFFSGKVYAKSPGNIGDGDSISTARYSNPGANSSGKSSGSYDVEVPVIIDIAHEALARARGQTVSTTDYVYHSNARPSALRIKFYGQDGCWSEIDGGYIGGSASGAVGSIGTAAAWASYPTVVRCGNGGNGADANAQISMAEYAEIKGEYPYGWGGFGGNGGGAGGPSGDGNPVYTLTCSAGTPGTGGKGGVGGKGADGCVIVYY